MTEYGYAGSILKVDLSDRKVEITPSIEYTKKYIGGHGLAARLYWEMVPPETKTIDPQNCFICASGPLAGFPGFAGFRWKICSKTNLDNPESFSYANLGDRWGAILKYAGYDALAVQGKAEKPVYIFIHDGQVEIKDASHLWGQSAFDAGDNLKAELGKGVSVLTIGPAAENLVPFSTVLAEGGASGSGGLGVVMGSKNLKAIVVAGDKRPKSAHPEQVRRLVDIIQANRTGKMAAMSMVDGVTHPHACYGCGINCYRQVYSGDNGRQYKMLCQAGDVYLAPSFRYSGRKDGARLLATQLCDSYGLDTVVMQSMIEFIEACYKEGILSEKETGLPLSRIGSPEFIEKLIPLIALRKGFGDVLSGGIIAAAGAIGPKAVEMLPRFVATRGSEKKDYDPRLLLITALCYATEPRRPIQQLHEVVMSVMRCVGGEVPSPGARISAQDLRNIAEKIWGSPNAADFSTYEGKALAAKKLQDRAYAKESLVVCDLRWTTTDINRAHGATGDTVTEAQIYSAITGKEIDEAELANIGERIFNLQRAILIRQGWRGRQSDSILDYFFSVPLQKGELFYNTAGLVPGKNGEFISRLGCVLDKNEFEKMKTEYYGYRGWDPASGLLTRAKLDSLALQDVGGDLAGRGFLAGSSKT
jgi:aldehyde:ferredoxin oxidoreductase